MACGSATLGWLCAEPHGWLAQNVRFLMLKIPMISEEIAMCEGGGIEIYMEILG